MRLEKMYRAYGAEFTEEISALEAGMDRFLDLSRNFIGSDNIKERQSKGVETQLAYLIFDDEIPAECFGNEAVFDGDELSGSLPVALMAIELAIVSLLPTSIRVTALKERRSE